MSSVAVEKVVELKRRAIALKEAGDVNGAMALLAEARDIEFENANIEDLWHPLKLKQFAVVLKKKGDLDGARQALLKAKQIETEGVATTTTTGGVPPLAQAPPATSNAALTETAAVAIVETRVTQEPQKASASQKANSIENDNHMEASDNENKQPHQSNIPEIQDNVAVPDDEDDDNDEAKDQLKELMQLDQDGDSYDDDDDDDGPMEVSYTIDDMADQEMMTEFRLGGMPTPSQEEYQAKILECKRSALAFKQAGNTARAMQELQKSKTLEQVRIALSHMNEGLGLRINEDVDGWIETLNDEESELLGEFLNKKPNTATGGGGSSHNLELVLEELSGFMEDPALLMDAINMGMTVPSVEEVQTHVQEQKCIAMEHKQAGDIERAKAALIQSKKFAAHAARLELIFQQMQVLQRQQDVNPVDIPLEQLEALAEDTEGGTATRTTAKKAQPKEPPQKVAPSVKSSQQLREEAIRLRDEKKIGAAAEVLKLYKEAVKREQDAADLRRRQEAVQELHHEMELAIEQIRIFEFYQRFVDPDTQQVANWNQYMANCAKVAKVIQLKGLETIQMDRKAGSLMCQTPSSSRRA
jgi:tetratricopeptide (TPR) repeat protein